MRDPRKAFRQRHPFVEAHALDYVFGYTCIVDVSARGLGGGVLFIDKSPDTFCPMGPWIVTRDEVPDPQKLSVKFWENDELRQDYNTDDMEHPIREIIAWASKIAMLGLDLFRTPPQRADWKQWLDSITYEQFLTDAMGLRGDALRDVTRYINPIAAADGTGLGVDVAHILVVGDRPDDLAAALEASLSGARS